jgi:hypothetical protein
MLSYDERDVLKTILREHRLLHDGLLMARLEELMEWVHDIERSKFDRDRHPQFPLVLLSLMGIYSNRQKETK